MDLRSLRTAYSYPPNVDESRGTVLTNVAWSATPLSKDRDRRRVIIYVSVVSVVDAEDLDDRGEGNPSFGCVVSQEVKNEQLDPTRVGTRFAEVSRPLREEHGERPFQMA
jgi:hypothetical protein